MRHAERGHFLVEAVASANPEIIGRVATEEDVARKLARVDVHGHCVLPALFFAGVHRIERAALTVELVILNCRRDRGDDWRAIRMFESNSQRTLPTQADTAESEISMTRPALAHPRRQ